MEKLEANIQKLVNDEKQLESTKLNIISELITLFNDESFKDLTVKDIYILRATLTNARNYVNALRDILGEAIYVFDHVDKDAAKNFIKNNSKSVEICNETEK